MFFDQNGSVHQKNFMELMNMLDRKKLGAKLKEIRKMRGYSLRDLEELCGVSRTTTSLYERGKMENISLATLEKIAKVLKIDLGRLLAECGDENFKLQETSEEFDTLFFARVSELSPQAKQNILSYLEFLLEQEGKGKKQRRKRRVKEQEG
ncbi:helix-turn-helix transcriptional regulator [Thermatribacter velox]|jgi:XRE family transcriptional regulator of biofilm formation|uniref:Helix-turn-helix transcriptional regulator n=2 Tax=Atribacterales TaxID=2847775 RepID=A0ABZ2YCZ1_9BACT